MADLIVNQIPSGKNVNFSSATPSQREAAWRLNGVSWAPPMSLDAYLARETALSETALAANCNYCVLFDPADSDQIISSCEAFAKTLFVRDASSPAGDVREEKAYGIASVYTNPTHRGNGMATLLLNRLKEAMDADSRASVLYSDIGTVYYARLGWSVYPSLQVSLIPDDASALRAPEGVRYLEADDVPAYCAKDTELLRKKLASLPADGKTHVAFAPSGDQMLWHFARDSFMAKELRGREVVRRGAATVDGRAWVYWDHDFREKKLKVLRVAGDPEADVTALLHAAVIEAADWELAKVLVWNPDSGISASAKRVSDRTDGAVRVIFDERLDGSIPSLRWKGEGEVVWEDNEYYAWC
ncbi:Lysine acetyltransferase 2 [Colletotrichum chlorophyti]|uniref:Lysine acetyltransferase 2 n=1 Tax=Colletotrichum chlorophyti TaxID=708187 RepID=A0A1Q8S778_9PEZI|nr:Lysine acetyltransferase 2 [Colletotrichum chlorophyti]